MSSIFISYSRKDLEIAEKIVSALAESKLDTWIDWKSIPKGEKFEKEIYQGIEGANVFLFLISPASVHSEWCNKEVAHAIINGKRIIPILIRDTDINSIPLAISERNWIHCRDGQDNFITTIEEINKTIHTDYEWLQFQTKLQGQALEWERNDHENSFLLHGKELEGAEKVFIANLGKEPFPTELQNQFIAKSRIAENQQIAERRKTNIRLRDRAITIGGIAVLAITATCLATLFGGQVGTSTINAQRQQKIALANQLSAQAQSIYILGDSRRELSVLLAIQSMKLYPSVQASQVLMNNSLAIPTINVAPNLYDNKSDVVVAFSPDGKYFITGTGGFDRVWDTATGREVSNFDVNNLNNLEFVRFTPDSKHIISVETRIIQIWDARTGSETTSITLDNNLANNIDAVDVSADGKYIVSASDQTAYVWEVSSKKVIAQKDSSDIIDAVAFSPDSKYVASASYNNIISVWNATTGMEIGSMTHVSTEPYSNITRLEFSLDGKFILSSNFDYGSNSIVHIWDANNYKEVDSMVHNGSVESVSFSPNSKYVVTGCSDHVARVWNIATGKVISQMLHNGNVTSVNFSPDSKYVISGSEDDTARVWDVATGKETARMTHNDDVLSVAFSPNGNYVGSGSSDNTARVWSPKEISQFTHEDSATRQEITRMIELQTIRSVVFSPDGKYEVSQSDHYPTSIRDVTTGKEISHMLASGSVVFSPDGRYIAIAGEDRNAVKQSVKLMTESSVSVWDVTTGQEIATMPYDGFVSTVAIFSPDGRFIAVGSSDNTARVWNVFTGEEVSRITHDDKVNAIAFSPDGLYVVSGSEDKTARVWEANTGKEIARVMHSDPVYLVAFSQNGKYVFSGSVEKLHTWMWQPEDLITNACSHVTRNLTQSEWKQYIGNVIPFQPVCPNFVLSTEFVPGIKLIDVIKEIYGK